MKNRLFKIVAGVVAIGSIALGGTALAAGTTAPSSTAVAEQAVGAAEAPGATVSGVVYTDTIQDESSADDATEVGQPEEAGSTPEVAGQAETEKPGSDGPGGHADEPGNPNADHQFDGAE